VHIFVTDEHYLPIGDGNSHFNQLRSQLLRHVAIPESNAHPVHTDLPPAEAAQRYATELEAVTEGAGLDLVVLDVGEDGHVAALFPGSEALYVSTRGACAHQAGQAGSWRITLTLPEINAARQVLLVATGPDKVCALANIATGNSGLPAERVRPLSSPAVWLVDEAAAARALAILPGSAAAPTSSDSADSQIGVSDTESNTAPTPKQRAGEAAAAEVVSGMAVGLGTGSTARFVTLAVGRRIREGEISDVVAVPTSYDTARLARENRIPVVTLAERPELDLAIDGADEVSPELDLIKGLGAALLREKIVALASSRFVVVADVGKRVSRLGTKAPVPVAVVQFGWTSTVEALRALGAEPTLRTAASGCPVVSDDGLYLVDCRFPSGLDEPRALDRAIRDIPGAVETGLFLGIADGAYLGDDDGVLVLPLD
jgi:ribose 5-phosphate isomerase A